jgi:hypothetical protein
MSKSSDDATLNDVRLLHKPRWQLVDRFWEMIAGNRTVAVLIPVKFRPWVPRFRWLTRILCDELPDYCWDNVDCTLEGGQELLEQWWRHACRGEAYRS